MADNDYTSLLGRRDQSWSQIAATLLQDQQKKNKKQKKRQRRALIGGMLLSAWDNNQLANVSRNLREADNDRQYEIADATQKWDAYSKFVEVDKKVVEKGDIDVNKPDTLNTYFLEQAEAAFNKVNDDFDTRYAGRNDRYAIRENEITDIAKKLQADHLQKRKQIESAQNIDVYKGINRPYLTKEEFTKPWNEYYRAKESRVSDPSELSAVHKLFGLVGPARTRRLSLDRKMENYRNQINTLNKAYDSLVSPTPIGDIKRFYNPDAIQFTESEAILYLDKIFTGEANQVLKRSIQNAVREKVPEDDLNTAIAEDRISDTVLNSIILARSYDFDLSKEKREQLGKDFDKAWSARTGKSIDEIATLNVKDKEVYDDERYVYVERGMGLEPEDQIKLREALVSIKAEELKGADKDINIIAYNQAIVENSTVSEKTKFAVSQFERIREDSNRYQLWLKRWDVYDQFLNDEGTKDLETGKTNYFIHLYNEIELALEAKTQ